MKIRENTRKTHVRLFSSVLNCFLCIFVCFQVFSGVGRAKRMCFQVFSRVGGAKSRCFQVFSGVGRAKSMCFQVFSGVGCAKSRCFQVFSGVGCAKSMCFHVFSSAFVYFQGISGVFMCFPIQNAMRSLF